MDKRLCLWDRSAVKCNDLVGHNSSISKVKVDQNNVAISAGYDASLLVWSFSSSKVGLHHSGWTGFCQNWLSEGNFSPDVKSPPWEWQEKSIPLRLHLES